MWLIFFVREWMPRGLVVGALLFTPLLLSFMRRAAATMANSYISGTHSVAYVTAPTEEVAKKLSHAIVEGKLAACVNIVPKTTSVYEWKGKINEVSEVLMIIKTRTTKVPELSDYVRANHPYEVCEFVSIPIADGSQPYLDWISELVPEKK